MATHSETNRSAANSESNTGEETPSLAILETRTGRKVLTEENNTEGWIATDLIVDVRK